jgi:hypothetical protein
MGDVGRAENRAPTVKPWFGPVVAAVLVQVGLTAVYLAPFGGNASALVCLDEKHLGQWPFDGIDIGFGKTGFDGQFYYALARNPWIRHPELLSFAAPYRHARILFLLLSWALSGGSTALLIWAMPLVNLLAIAGLAWLGCELAGHYGRNPWWGFALPLVLNVGTAALRDLTDPLAAFTVCGMLAAWLLRWPAWQLGAWAVAAVLSREQNAAVVVLLLLESLRHRSWPKTTLLTGALVVLLAWVGMLKWTYGDWPTAPGNLDPPFAGMWYRWTHLVGGGSGAALIHALGMCLLTVQVGLSLSLVPLRAERLTALVALAGACLAVMGGHSIYENGWSYPRVFLWMPLALWLWGVQTGRNWPTILSLAVLMWPLSAVIQVWCR